MSDELENRPPGIAPGMSDEEVELEMDVAMLEQSLLEPPSSEEIAEMIQSVRHWRGLPPLNDGELQEAVAYNKSLLEDDSLIEEGE